MALTASWPHAPVAASGLGGTDGPPVLFGLPKGWARLGQVLRADDPTDGFGATWGVEEQVRTLPRPRTSPTPTRRRFSWATTFPVFGPTGQVATAHGHPGPGALDRGGVDCPHAVGAHPRVAGQHADQPVHGCCEPTWPLVASRLLERGKTTWSLLRPEWGSVHLSRDTARRDGNRISQ